MMIESSKYVTHLCTFYLITIQLRRSIFWLIDGANILNPEFRDPFLSCSCSGHTVVCTDFFCRIDVLIPRSWSSIETSPKIYVSLCVDIRWFRLGCTNPSPCCAVISKELGSGEENYNPEIIGPHWRRITSWRLPAYGGIEWRQVRWLYMACRKVPWKELVLEKAKYCSW